jgi:hypothetical protein
MQHCPKCAGNVLFDESSSEWWCFHCDSDGLKGKPGVKASSSVAEVKSRLAAVEFQNPTGNWSYEGAYSVELTDRADMSVAPVGSEFLKIEGNRVVISEGRAMQGMGGIQLYVEEYPFFLGYVCLKCIRRGDGFLLWKNNNYDNM